MKLTELYSGAEEELGLAQTVTSMLYVAALFLTSATTLGTGSTGSYIQCHCGHFGSHTRTTALKIADNKLPMRSILLVVRTEPDTIIIGLITSTLGVRMAGKMSVLKGEISVATSIL